MRRKFNILLVCMLLPQTSLFAQKDTSRKASKLSELSLEELMNIEITTASQKKEKLREAPATVYVITQDDIRKRGYVHLKDVLRDLPGLETIENYAGGISTLVPVRGVIGNNKIVVLVNGRKVNPPGGEEMNLASNFNILQAHQIEIMYGLGSTHYGQDAINAVINVITEQPKERIKLDVMAKGGMINYKEGVLAVSGNIPNTGNDNVRISSSFSYTDAELSNVAKEFPELWNTIYGKIVSNVGISNKPYRPDKGMNGFLRIENSNSSLQVFHTEATRNTGEGGAAGAQLYTDESKHISRTTVISANNEFKFSNKLFLNSSTSYSRYELDKNSLYVSPIRDTAIKENYVYAIGSGLRLEELLTYEVTKKITLRAGILAALYDILPRVTFRDKVDTDKDIASQADVISYYTRKNDPTSKVVLSTANNINYFNYGSFAEGNVKISDKLIAILGFRIDMDTRFKELPLSPRVALIYNPTSTLNVKYIYNRGYLAPSSLNIFSVFDIGSRINISNIDLQPERASSNEININYVKNHVNIGTAFYYNIQENLIFAGDAANARANVVQDTVWTDLEGNIPKRLTRQVNSGRSRAFGTDIFGKIIFNKITAWASFSYVNFERDLGTEKSGLNKLSPVNVRLGFSILPIKKLVITPSIIFRSTPDNITNKFGLDNELKNPYEINTYISYTPTKSNLTFFLDARNITNHNYVLRGYISFTSQEPFRLLGGIRFITGS